MDRLPKWSVTTYNALSLVQTRRLRHILSDMRWTSFVCIQGSHRRTTEPVIQYSVEGFNVLEWGYTPVAGKSSGILIAFRNKLFGTRQVAQVYTPPEELIGRVGAVRLKRGDADFMVINAYIAVNPQKYQDKLYCNKLWAWVHHVVSLAPRRCVPILCSDANGRVGSGPPCEGIGNHQSDTENFNGEKLRELLTDHHMAAVNTFFPAGDTFFGHFGRSSRIDYICLPVSMLERVKQCAVLYAAGKRLQLIPVAGKRDHMPVQCIFQHKLGYDTSSSAFRWDRDALAWGVLHGYQREKLFATCEAVLGEFDIQEHGNAHPDKVWTVINTAVMRAAQECYTARAKHAADPQDTREAHEHTVAKRTQLVSLSRPHRASYVALEGFSLDFLSSVLQQWKCLVQYWKARKQLDVFAKRDRQHQLQRQLSELDESWQRRDFASMWRVAHRLSGKCIGPKKRTYNAPMCLRPSIAEWNDHLAKPGKDGGWHATMVQKTDAHAYHPALYSAREVCHLADQDMRGLASQLHRAPFRKAVPPWAVPVEVWRQLVHPKYHRMRLRSGLGYRALRLGRQGSKCGCVPLHIQLEDGVALQRNGSTACHFRSQNTITSQSVTEYVSSVAWIPVGLRFTNMFGRNVSLRATGRMLRDITRRSQDMNPSANYMLCRTDCVEERFPMLVLFTTSRMLFPVNQLQPYPTRFVRLHVRWTSLCWSSGTRKFWLGSVMAEVKLTLDPDHAPCRATDHQLSFSLNHTTLNWTAGRRMLQSMILSVACTPRALCCLVTGGLTFPWLHLRTTLAAFLWVMTQQTSKFPWKLPMQALTGDYGKSSWCRMWINKNMWCTSAGLAAMRIWRTCMLDLTKLYSLPGIWGPGCTMLENL